MLRTEIESLGLTVAFVGENCEICKSKCECHSASLDRSDQYKSMLSEYFWNLRNLLQSPFRVYWCCARNSRAAPRQKRYTTLRNPK